MSLLRSISLMSRALFKRNQTRSDLVLPTIRLELEQGLINSTHIAGYNACTGWKQKHLLSPTYLHVLASSLHMQLLLEREQPFALLGLVHIANCIEQFRPIQTNEDIRLQSYLDNLQPHPKGWCFDMVTEAFVDDALVWREVSTNLSRGKVHDVAKLPSVEITDELKSFANIVAPTNMGRRYAHYSGDYNPIHLFAPLAKCFGFKRHIAHGMWSKARCIALLADELPPSFKVTVNFTRPFFLPGQAQLKVHTQSGKTVFELASLQNRHLAGVIDTIKD